MDSDELYLMMYRRPKLISDQTLSDMSEDNKLDGSEMAWNTIGTVIYWNYTVRFCKAIRGEIDEEA